MVEGKKVLRRNEEERNNTFHINNIATFFIGDKHMNDTNKTTNAILSIITWTFIIVMALFAVSSAIAAPKIRPPAPFTEIQLSPHFTWEKVPEEEYLW